MSENSVVTSHDPQAYSETLPAGIVSNSLALINDIDINIINEPFDNSLMEEGNLKSFLLMCNIMQVF